MQKEEQVSFLAEKIRQADAVLIGGGSGLSSAAGYNHYHWLLYMEECLQDFKEWYGLKSPFDGFYYCYSSPEQQWAYYARYIQSMWDAPTGQPYYDLRVASELLPSCNECGRIMVPWVRDDTFLEGKDWREGVRRYENFLKKYLMNGTDKNVVLLELRVGEMTPGNMTFRPPF